MAYRPTEGRECAAATVPSSIAIDRSPRLLPKTISRGERFVKRACSLLVRLTCLLGGYLQSMETSRLRALGLVLLTASLATSAATAAPADIRIENVVGSPDPPRADAPFELIGRVLFVGGGPSLHCRVFVGARRYRNVRLVWDGTTARCSFAVPAAARGKGLSVALVAGQGMSRARTTLRYRVS